MKNFRIFIGIMMFVFAAFLFTSVAANAAPGGNSAGGLPQLQADLDAEAAAREAADAALQTEIDTIELTPGPQGEQGLKGDKGDTGSQGPQGDSIQGPQGEPGTSSWTDGFETVTTFGSVQIGSGPVADVYDDCTSANAGTIRFTGTAFEACDGTVWGTLNVTAIPVKVDADNDGFYDDVDCDDNDYYVNPGATEVMYDGNDNDCDPSTPDGVDADNDGWSSDVDCNDDDYNVNPGTVEIMGNGIDDDCDSSTPDIYAIGLTGPAGGIVFYVTADGLNGMEAAPSDQSSGAVWGCNGNVLGATGTAVGTGAQNTQTILATCNEAGIAARIATAYTLNGYTDWYLPSKDEINLLFSARNLVGGFCSDSSCNTYYWTSSEYDAQRVWYKMFSVGGQTKWLKTRTYRVRAIRDF